MTAADIAAQRLVNQQLTGTKFGTAKELVSWLGAVQAQDYGMAKWALGVRLPGSTESMIEQAVDAGEIVRTHVLRPTWHFVAAEDIRWMLALTAPRINAAIGSYNRTLGLDAQTFKKSNRVIEKALRGGKHLLRTELAARLADAGIVTNNARVTHMMFNAELDGLVCNGPRRGRQDTYALLDERIPETPTLTKEEALAELATRYFRSHGPATDYDFAWWSGLTMAEARRGMELMGSKLLKEEVGASTYWFSDASTDAANAARPIHFLPAYDEFTIAYKDRTPSLDPAFAANISSGHGIFKPIIVVDGKVIGTWKRSYTKDAARIETAFWKRSTALKKREVIAATDSFGAFVGKRIEIL